MAEFKKLSEVEAVRAVQDNANVLIEEDGAIKRRQKDWLAEKVKSSYILALIVITLMSKDIMQFFLQQKIYIQS